MKLLLSYLRPYRGMVVLAISLAVVNQVFSLLDPQIFRIITDRYAMHIDTLSRPDFIRGVGLLILAFIGVAMVSRIAKNFQDYYINVVSQSVGASMYADGIAHSLRLPFRAFEDQQSGAVLTQLQKARTDSRDMIGQSVNTVFISSLTFLLVLGYSFFVHWSIGATLIVMAPVLAFLLSRLAAGSSRCRQRSSGRPMPWQGPRRRACATSSSSRAWAWRRRRSTG
jgi:ATP-binding cassette subfamily B protein